MNINILNNKPSISQFAIHIFDGIWIILSIMGILVRSILWPIVTPIQRYLSYKRDGSVEVEGWEELDFRMVCAISYIILVAVFGMCNRALVTNLKSLIEVCGPIEASDMFLQTWLPVLIGACVLFMILSAIPIYPGHKDYFNYEEGW